MTWREVADRVFVLRHLEELGGHGTYDINVGLIVGDGGCLVIDTREQVAAGREIAAAVRTVTAAPWTVVNTHAHLDHFLGNAAFAPTDIWALHRCQEVITRLGDAQRRALAHRAREAGLEAMAASIDESPVLPPNQTFRAPTVQLDIGGRAVTLHHVGRGHTDNDVVISLADCPVVFAGDLVEEGAPPAFDDAYPIEWGATLGALLPMLVGPVVPGHGDVVDAAFVEEQQQLHIRVATAARGDAGTVPGLPDDVAALALARARAELDGSLTEPTVDEVLAAAGLG